MADTIANPSAESTDAPTDEQGRIVGGSIKSFKARIERCKTKRRELLREWQINVDYRRGKPVDVDTDEGRSSVTADWSQTNAKIAQLFSQTPEVIVTGDGPYKPAAMPVQKRLNWILKKAKIGACMDEVLPDVLNAAGIGVAIVSYEQRDETREVPEYKLEDADLITRTLVQMGLKKIPMVDQTYVTDRKFSVDRVGPEDFIWPVEFEKSDFDESPFLGRGGRAPWAEAKSMFPTSDGNRGLLDEDKDKAMGDDRTTQDRLSMSAREDVTREEDIVCFDEIYYWRYLYHEDEKYFSAIQRVVFVDGVTDPVINEKWKGQRFDEEMGNYVGACRFPVRVLSLHYISSECIPPSESAVTRTTVKELMRGRQQMSDQRDHSKPIRWADTNRIDADIMTSLMMGDWQGFIPTQGPGDKAIGEVARSNYPPENAEFDRVFKADLMEARSLGPNQMGTLSTGPRSAAESKITQGNFTTVISQQRARCTSFMIGIADVMFGLMALYDDFELPDQQDGQRLQNWDRTRISHELAFSVRLDSSVLLDSEQRIDRIMRFLNIAGKSGRVNPGPVLEELAALSGLDPALVITPPPEGNKPELPKISFNFKGVEDLNDPVVVGILIENNQAPSPQSVMNAKKLIASAKMGAETDPVGTPSDGSVPPMADDRPEWQSVDRINSRRDASQE